MPADYFTKAATIVRDHEQDRRDGICRCNAYAFPHRIWSGSCNGPDIDYGVGGMSQWDREENDAFNQRERESA